MAISQRLKRLNARLAPGRLLYGPEWLVLGVNNACNLHCKMCDVGTGFTESGFYQNLMGTKPVNMPMDLADHILDAAHREYPQVRIGYAFTEPLAWPHLSASIDRATGLGLSTAVTTNGLLLPKHAEALADAGLVDLYLSLDGPAAIHNEIRGHERSFERAIEGVEKLLARPRHPQISVFCVITPWNVGHLEAMVTAMQDLPLTALGFMHTNFTPEAVVNAHNQAHAPTYAVAESNMAEMAVEDVDLAVLRDQIARIRTMETRFPVSFSPEIDGQEALEKFYQRPDQLWGRQCGDVNRSLMIKSDGSAIPAHGRCYPVALGNIRDQSMSDLWKGSAMTKFRRDLGEAGGLFPACSRCCSAFG